MPTRVTVDNFVRAESDRMLAAMQAQAGGVNRFSHLRVPTPLDKQTVIRMNRDTLYSFALVDLAAGATFTMPDAGDRYCSAMIVNQDHHINRVIHAPGEHHLTQEEFESRHVLVAVRVLADPEDPADLAAANTFQDGLAIHAASAVPLVMADYDQPSFDATRNALLELARGGSLGADTFGSRAEVDPIHHLLGTAAGWGGLPASEAIYVNRDLGLPVAEYRIRLRDVPVDAFWSISLYNAQGFFEPGLGGAVSVSSVTARRDADGSITVHLGGCGDGRPNCLGLMDGWNYTVRLYRPRAEIRDGGWSFPEPERIG